MARQAGSYATIFGADIVQFIQYNLHFIRPRHDIAARPDPLTEEMLMLNNIPQQHRPTGMLQRQHKRVRTRPIELLDKTPLNPQLQPSTAQIEEVPQQP